MSGRSLPESNRAEADGDTATNLFICDELSHLTDLLKGERGACCVQLARLSHLWTTSQLSHLSLKEKKLNSREKQLEELSLLAANAQDTISAYVEEQVSKTAYANQKTIDELRSSLRVTEGELERLKHSYEVSRNTNQHLRCQLEELKASKLLLEKDSKQLQARVASLQAARAAQPTSSSYKQHSSSNNSLNTDPPSRPVVKKKLSGTCVEHRDSLLVAMMDWMDHVLLDSSCSQATYNSTNSRRVIPLLVKVLPELSSSHHLPFLKITLWSIRLLAEKGSLSSSLRSIGHYILCPVTGNTSKHGLFLHSPDISTRTLSSLCLLSTLTEEDAQLTALQCLLQDMTIIECQHLFVQCSGVSILAEVIRPANRRASQLAVTILTMLSLNSVEQCASESCIKAVAGLLQQPTQITKETLNNITILLQRLSENRLCWKWFITCGLVSSLERMRDIAAASLDADSQFRLRNIQSILKNKPHAI